ncbi:MAG TPA: alpha-2-macroglobulin family protein, partial [Gemmataceae bacterium]|nr:alpha-2-macroglobulin family protein [Gemmataceae bacterium]
PVDIDLRDNHSDRNVHLASFTTNAEGTGQPRFELPEWGDGEYELQVVARPTSGPEVLTERVHLKRSWKVMLTSDKPVYQPGQTIHVRSLALRQIDLKPVAGQTMTFSISDPKRNVIFKRADPNSKFGIAAIDCPLASEIIEGPYTIACQLGDTNSQLTVEVKKYVLPKFKVDVTLDQPYYQPGQKVKVQVHGEYFFGKPVVNGQVDIRLFTTDVQTNAARELKARTDASGNAKFEFALPDSLVGTEQNSGDAQISLDVKLIDTAGQEQTRRSARTVTANPIHLEVIPETVPLMQHQLNTIFVYASYADGRPARARLSISNSDKELVTNSLGVASFEIDPESEQFGLTLHATDAEGRFGHRHVDLQSRGVTGDFIMRTDKAVYHAGETVQLLALGGATEPIFVDLLKDGQTILTQTIDMSKRRGFLQIDLSPDLFGTLELCAYRFGATGSAVRKTRALYVHPVRQLEVKTALDRSEYRPGRTAKVQLALRDNQGNPVPGALSLAAVDEAVYSVLDQRPGLEGTFYTLDQDLLRPIYAIYAWSPDLRSSASPADRNLLEQALFARTLHEGGRDAVLKQLLPFLENNERTFDVLKRPDWEQLADERISPATKSVLRFGNAPHTLSDASFAIKARELGARKQHGLELVKFFWGLFTFLCVMAGLIVLFSFVRRFAELIVVFLIVIVLIGLILPATQQVREASNRMLAENSLRQIDQAVEAFQDAHGALPKNPKWIDAYKRQDTLVEGRVRQWFPETLFWRPEIITDDKGRARIDIDLADSITTWRLTASAVSADGRLGATQAPIRVFQPFFVDLNLPVSLTRGDEVAIPVVVYNYLDKPQTVELSLENAGWFERLDEASKRVELKPNEVRSTSYRLRARQVGNFELQVTARGSGVADALKKPIEVVPDGRRVEQVFNGTLQNPAQITVSIPDQIIDGSARVILKIYPSTFSQLVEGLDAIFQMPYGCFEQTSSTTYPNVLALEYLRQTNKNAPAVEAKARQYIHLGYQRLLGFEVAGGGFDWFGRPPANRTLTAYGLMEFQDMARVHDIDANLIARTRQWLLSQRNRDGSWTPEAHQFHGDPAQQAESAELARLAATAYIAWAVFDSGAASGEAGMTLDCLLAHQPATIRDPYVLALVANALLAMHADGREAQPYLARLDLLKHTSVNGKLTWWEQPAHARTSFYGSGTSGSIETTAVAVLALLKAGREPGTARAALAWLAAQKDSEGTWHSTQATVLALKALLAGTGKPLGGDTERRIEMSWEQGSKSLLIPADQAEVMQQLDLTTQLGHGSHRLTIAERTGSAAGYQVALRYHVPDGGMPEKQEPLAIDISYDRTELAVGSTVTATATVLNRMDQAAPMVILDLPIPPGFAIDADDLAGLVTKGTIAKYQLNPRSALIYLRELEPGKPLTLAYHLRATMPVKVTASAARAYEYYDTQKQGLSKPAKFTVSALKE